VLRSIFTALVLFAAAPSTPAQVGAPPQADASERLILAPAWLDLVLNEVRRQTILVQLSGGDVWASAEDLERAGLELEGGDRIDHQGRSLVSLRSLAPAVTFTVDEAALALHVTAAQRVLGRTRLDLRVLQRPPDLVTREAPSAYLNWAARADGDGARTATSELGISAGAGLLVSGATLDSTNGPVRGLTTGYWDDSSRLLRVSAGDIQLMPGDPLGGTALVLGGSIGRELSLDPYLLRSPQPRTSVFSSTPATLEVWVDDTLVRRTQVVPGTIDLENIPANAGMSQIRTVLRDAFGREESASTYALVGSSILLPGLVDWGASAGVRRKAFGTESFSYGGPLAMARVRAGVDRLLTLGARAEAGDGLAGGGASAALATPVGEIEAAAAASRDGGESGAALFAAWRKTGRAVSAVAQLRWDSGRFANASMPASVDRPVLRASVAGALPVTRRLSLLGELAGERRRDTEDTARGTLRLTWSSSSGVHAGVSASRSLESTGPGAFSLLVTMSIPMAGRATASVQGAAGTRSGYAQVGLGRSLRNGPGVGYRLAARGGDGAFASGELQAQNGWGRVDLEHQEIDPATGARSSYSAAQVASGLVLIDGRVFPTRPVEGSYALVDVGAPGVRVALQGQEVGRTGSRGEVLVTGLTPYLANRLSIRDSDLPLDYRVDEVDRIVAPRPHGGTVERFRIAQLRAVAGTIVLDLAGRDVPPEWGEIAVELAGRREVSPIGSGGTFWLDGIPAGIHQALVRWEGRLCRFSFEVGAEAGVIDLGKVRCDQMLVQERGSPAGADPALAGARAAAATP
jgi:outer membrane usher protein